MIVKKITPRGFCKGVYQAIEIVKQSIENKSLPKPIYVLGFIVHNKHVVQELDKLGVITLDDRFKSRLELVEDIKEGTIILSAHGTDEAVKRKIIDNKLTLIDATCNDVYKTHDSIKEYLNKGFNILYIGKKNHPETNASLSIDSNIKLIENIEDLNEIKLEEPLFVTNQTTFSINDILPIHEKIKSLYPNSVITEEICNATRFRQNAIIEGNKNVDLCYIVGDPRSNNSRNLVKISKELTSTKTFLIESVKDIDLKDLENVNIVSVSSGASTPNYLTQEVIDFLENL
ncbi:MAG: 4-hydroxy-3-methylbut-2-enyl diphosphate reductase [Candidatus Izemoplasmatales bacterium]|nr:4-hydroxy-3-methylbut-2-enyl diphosphate reductase [Candidatus Izemoplasmatales bacterium]MDD4069366.1 4-hydroxy-3-methylbut-2-enyl diphosphate reductase [Candidatus Izemoplasmatales bacterium]